jgi:hypothetical protein
LLHKQKIMAAEKELTHEESIRIIQSMIQTAKSRITENGFHFLLWGVLVIAASLGQYVWLGQGGGNETNLVWMLMPAIGVPAAFVYEWRADKNKQVRTHLDSCYSFIWIGFGIALGLIIYTALRMHTQTLPFILIITGLATFVSGCLFRFKPLIAGGIVFWVACVASSFISAYNQLLLNAAATFLGYIVPGVLLWQNYKRENNV